VTGRDLDMSLCFCAACAHSPAILKNMGVGATLVVSLVSAAIMGIDRLPPLRASFIHFELRAVCELLAEAIATRITALEASHKVNRSCLFSGSSNG